MRPTFFSSLFGLAKRHKDVTVVTADMGFSLLEPFRDTLPSQYVNTGVAEANTISVAAGMALMGKRPYAYSIVPFITCRCLEQTRVDVCYQNTDVKLIGVGGGLDYAQSGATHQSIEDIGVMRSLPNMSVVCPADSQEAAALPEALYGIRTPVYVRLGRGREPVVHKSPVRMEIGKGIELIQPKGRNHIAILATGNITHNALRAAESLRAQGIDVSVASMPWVKPLDEKLVLSLASSGRMIVTVEEHSYIGGLRSAAADLLCEKGAKAQLKSISLPDAFQKTVGSQEYLRQLNGLDIPSIAKRISSWARQ
jgi:transketolase